MSRRTDPPPQIDFTPAKEEAIYQLDRDVLGFQIVPASKYIKSAWEHEGTLSRWIDTDPHYDDDGVPHPHVWDLPRFGYSRIIYNLFLEAMYGPTGWWAAILHCLIGAQDAFFLQNVMVMAADGHVVSFDNSVMDPLDTDVRSFLFHHLRRTSLTPPEVREKARQLVLDRPTIEPAVRTFFSQFNPQLKKPGQEHSMQRHLCIFFKRLERIASEDVLPNEKMLEEDAHACALENARVETPPCGP